MFMNFIVTIYHHFLTGGYISVELLSRAFLTFCCSILMANDINNFVNNMDLNISNSFIHTPDTENSDEFKCHTMFSIHY